MPQPLLPLQQARVEQAKFGHEHGIVARQDEHVVTRENLRRLCSRTCWLRESVISFFMRLIEIRNRDSALNLPKVYALDSFFISVLMRKGYHEPKVRQTIDIFEFDMVLCPINTRNSHWSLAVLYHDRKVLEYFDSMGGSNVAAIDSILEYVCKEHLALKSELIEPYKVVLKTDIPLQENGWDCGPFICLYAERLARRAPFDFNQSHMQHYRQKIAFEILTNSLL